MILKKFMTTLVLASVPVLTSFASDKPTLGDFLEAFPDVANFKASPYCYHCTPEKSLADVKGTQYEVRYVTFTDGQGKAKDLSFKEFIVSENLSSIEGKDTQPNPYLSVYYFTQPDSCKEKGVYFILSFKAKD